MAKATAVASAHFSGFDALVSISKTLAEHKTIAELFQVLADHLHTVVPFDYLALILHDEQTDEMRVVVLEPKNLLLPFVSRPVTDHGPAATVWETQTGAVVPIREQGPLPPAMEFARNEGMKVACFLPLTTAHRKIGVLSFGSRSATAYADDVLAFMGQVAAVVAIAVDNKINYDESQRYQQEIRKERDRLRFLLDSNNFLVSRLDRRALLKAIADV